GRRLPYLRLVDGGHESPLGGLRFPELVLDALAGSGQTVAALLEGVEPGDESGHLGLAEVDTGPQGAELTADLRRLPARAEAARVGRRKRRLRGRNGAVELAQTRAQLMLLRFHRRLARRRRLGPGLEGGDLPAGQVQLQRRQLGGHLAVAAGGVGLALEGTQ